MKTLQINGIHYNLAHLISVEYNQTPRDTFKKGEGYDKGRYFKTDEVKFSSVLNVVFMDCQPITFRDSAADQAWKIILDVVKPSPVAELSTRILPE